MENLGPLVEAWSLSGVLGAQPWMVVEVRGVVHVVTAQDTMTANSTDGMAILVFGMWDLAETGVGVVTTRAAVTATLAATLTRVGYSVGFSFEYGGHVVFPFEDMDSEFQTMVEIDLRLALFAEPSCHIANAD